MIGFIGCGNMGRAIINGMMKNGFVKGKDIIASAASAATAEYIDKTLGITAASSNAEVVEKSDIIFLAVKPQMLSHVITEIRDLNLQGKTFVSMSPGKSLAWFRGEFKKDIALVRTAPNTPLMCGEGMTCLCANELTKEEDLEQIRGIFEASGRTALIPEKLMDTAMALGGSTPAYVYMFIEALADGAVAEGMPRPLAYEIAAQTVMGSAKMVLTSGKHPGALKDEVTSPAGTTIEGLNVLEDAGFRSAVMGAIRECVDKSRRM